MPGSWGPGAWAWDLGSGVVVGVDVCEFFLDTATSARRCCCLCLCPGFFVGVVDVGLPFGEIGLLLRVSASQLCGAEAVAGEVAIPVLSLGVFDLVVPGSGADFLTVELADAFHLLLSMVLSGPGRLGLLLCGVVVRMRLHYLGELVFDHRSHSGGVIDTGQPVFDPILAAEPDS